MGGGGGDPYHGGGGGVATRDTEPYIYCIYTIHGLYGMFFLLGVHVHLEDI